MPSDPTLYLYTSLSSGSSHILTATSRIEIILKANKIPFKAIDLATDEKARMLWTRRSKGRKIPGLVKFNDVIADLEQVEEWNEYGELEDQIEDQVDIFGDVPISATSAEAHAAAAARAQAQEEARQSAQAPTGRTASETRHISISEPKKEDQQKADGQDKKNPSLSMAMKQAGAEAAAKAGAKKAAPANTSAKVSDTKAKTDMPPPSQPTPTVAAVKLEGDIKDGTEADTEAKTPQQLAAEGASKTSVDKLAASSSASSDDDSSTLSTHQQILDRRKSSQPNVPSALAKETSISESHTVETKEEQTATKSSMAESETAPKKHRGSDVTDVDRAKAAVVEKANAIKEENSEEEDDEDEDDDEEEEDDSDEDEESEEEEEQETKKPAPKPTTKATTAATKVSATNTGEAKALKGTKPQEGSAKDGSKAGDSVAD